MEDLKQQESQESTLKPIQQLIDKYGNDVVEKRVKELEQQLQGTVTELDETYFVQAQEIPKAPSDEQIAQIIGLITELYLAEGRTLRILELQKDTPTKYITPPLRQRINNLYVNNRVLLDVFLKKFEISEIDYLNPLANAVESITNLFIACKPEDREHCILEFKKYLEGKYIKNETTESNIS
jgi:hypothetical protein